MDLYGAEHRPVTQQARAEFRRRPGCITCRCEDLTTRARGTFAEGPVRRFIESDPFGVSPIAFLGDHPWEFVECARCGQMFHRWLLTPEWQDIRFSQWMTGEAIRAFEEDNGYNSPENRFRSAVEFTRHVLRIEQATRSLRGREAARVLDFGCGWGEFLSIAHLFGFEAVGVERSPDRIAKLRQAGVTAFPDIESLREGIDAGFHAVTLFQVLEHVEEPLDLLMELRGVMAAGAVLVLEVPDCSGVTGIHDLSDFRKIDPLEHINCFTPTSLAKMARLAGFEPIPRPIAHVTTRATKVLKGEVRRFVQRFLPPTTDRYFRRTPRE